MKWFRTQKEKASLSNLKNLVMLSIADGEIDDLEKHVIALVAARDNASVEDFDKFLKGEKNIENVIPKTEEEKLRHLKDLVLLMVVDGRITHKELEIVESTANAYGYSDEIYDIIEAIISDIPLPNELKDNLRKQLEGSSIYNHMDEGQKAIADLLVQKLKGKL